MSLDIDYRKFIKDIPDIDFSGSLIEGNFDIETVGLGRHTGYQPGTPSSAYTNEGEFETLINSYHSGQLQPRSGPRYKDYDRFGGHSMSFHNYLRECIACFQFGTCHWLSPGLMFLKNLGHKVTICNQLPFSNLKDF